MLTRFALNKTASVTPNQVKAACNDPEFYYVLNKALNTQGASGMHGGCRDGHKLAMERKHPEQVSL
jgi:hypothetical protein